MSVVVALVVGAVLAALLERLARPVFASSVFRATNFRGRELPVGVGFLVAVAVLVAECVWIVGDRTGHGPGAPDARILVALTVVGFALVGLVDDVAASGSDRGFRGHVRALAHGRLTTGGLKLLAGGVLAFVVSGMAEPRGLPVVLLDTLLIALSANLANLFDRAPGRVGKLGILGFLALSAATGSPPALVGVAATIGAVVGLLPGDLGERFMLGDAGANPVGAALGLGVVLTTGVPARVVVLLVVLSLNAASEVVSFGKLIESTPVLRELDRLGRRG